ncbi:hypothetical protein SAMN05428949_1167 [Chitinophaga sp. YR627]|uniref:hypothetical protein n=1 Tax=Chitinophaga sp. YR627 TaxID=1881041 RepID=UPI0008DF1B15|nr:hypothetical protein [Chitinophaga sp. YR627]SFM88414.1 hypothetical protein SAMN05428949_1167 [Chitinophaga sp. YR627]
MDTEVSKTKKQIRTWIIFFIISLSLSGITAFAVETELSWVFSWWPEQDSSFYKWLYICYQAIKDMNDKYPYLAYGYDWLAFAHIVIAIAFIGPLKDPVKNIWVIEFGCIACVAVIPLALIAGYIRQIPVFWCVIDCSFGVIGIIPLLICHRKIRQLEKVVA